MILRPTIFSLRTHQPRNRQRPCTTLGGFALLLCICLIAGCGGSNGAEATNASSGISAAGVEAAMSAAEEYFASREYASAEIILEKLLEKKSDIVEAWELLGQVRYSQAAEAEAGGQRTDAASKRTAAYAAYSRAVELDSKSAGLQHSAGMMALLAGFDAEARQHFAEAGALDPTNVQHPLYEAQVLLKQHRLDEAEAALERALSIDAEEPFTISSLAVIALEREEFARAIELIEQARAIDARSLGFRLQEARIRRRAGQPRQAIDLLQPLPPAQRAELGVASELAACYESIGDFSRAASTWAHRMQHVPGDWQAALRAAEAFIRAGNRAEASVMYQSAVRIAPHEPDVKAFSERMTSTGPP